MVLYLFEWLPKQSIFSYSGAKEGEDFTSEVDKGTQVIHQESFTGRCLPPLVCPRHHLASAGAPVLTAILAASGQRAG